MHKQIRILLLATGCLALQCVFSGIASAEPLWKQFVPKQKVAADPNGTYQLTEANGPWLIMAATFSGEGAQEQAQQLVFELRKAHNMPAYLHGMTFDLKSKAPMRGVDHNGRMKASKFQRGDSVKEIAVLVGDFSQVDDPKAQRFLKEIKTMRPETLVGEQLERTTQNLASLRTMQNMAKSKKKKA